MVGPAAEAKPTQEMTTATDRSTEDNLRRECERLFFICEPPEFWRTTEYVAILWAPRALFKDRRYARR